MSVPVVFIEPFDETVRLRVAAALRGVGARIAAIFVAPVDADVVSSYLGTEGLDHQLVIPIKEGLVGADLVADLHDAGGIPRQILVPVRDDPERVRNHLAGLLPPEALSRLLVARIQEILAPEFRERLARHFQPARAIARAAGT